MSIQVGYCLFSKHGGNVVFNPGTYMKMIIHNCLNIVGSISMLHCVRGIQA